MSQTENRTIIELYVVDARVLVDNMKDRREISYETVREIIHRDPQEYPGRGITALARKYLLRDHRQVWRCNRKIGFFRMRDEAVATGIPEECRKSLQRRTRRAISQITTVDFRALSDEAKIKHNAGLSLMGMIAFATRSGAVKKIEMRVKDSSNAMPSAEALRLLAGNGK